MGDVLRVMPTTGSTTGSTTWIADDLETLLRAWRLARRLDFALVLDGGVAWVPRNDEMAMVLLRGWMQAQRGGTRQWSSLR